MATVLVETGMVKVKEPYTDIVLEAPTGFVKVCVKVDVPELGRICAIAKTKQPTN